MKHSLKKVIRSGWTNFKRNTYLSIAVTGVMALVLAVLLALISFQFLTKRLVSTLQEKVDISAYFKAEATEGAIAGVKADIEKLPEVKSVTYISREQAHEEFTKRHADNPLIQESLLQLDDNPFEATLNITATDPTRYETIATYLENSSQRDLISKINYNENKDVIDRINRVASALRRWGLGVVLVIALIAVLITFNTIRLTIFNQKQEIEIMRLVGASNWYIRGPYIAEGGFYGVIGALIALIIFYPIVFAVSDNILVLMPEVNLMRYFLVNSWQVVVITLFTGILLGTLSSIIAIRKHLKI